jgi:hypothetical protein
VWWAVVSYSVPSDIDMLTLDAVVEQSSSWRSPTLASHAYLDAHKTRVPASHACASQTSPSPRRHTELNIRPRTAHYTTLYDISQRSETRANPYNTSVCAKEYLHERVYIVFRKSSAARPSLNRSRLSIVKTFGKCDCCDCDIQSLLICNSQPVCVPS